MRATIAHGVRQVSLAGSRYGVSTFARSFDRSTVGRVTPFVGRFARLVDRLHRLRGRLCHPLGRSRRSTFLRLRRETFFVYHGRIHQST